MTRFLLSIVLTLSSFFLYSQQDTNYVRDFRQFGNLSLAMEQKANNLAAFSSYGNVLRLATNNGFPTFGLMFSYKWLNVWFTTPLGHFNYTDPIKGETDNFGLALGYTGDHWWIRGFYEHYSGYHISNPEVFNPNWFDDNATLPLVPGLQSRTFYANAYYGFNEETYSHRALLWQSQAQKKSAGSWILGLSAGYDHIFSDTVIVPDDAEVFFYDLRNVTGYETLTTGINIGYTYSFVFSERWSLGLMLAPGIATSVGVVEEVNDVRNNIELELGGMVEGRAMLSYHADRWFGGVSANGYMLTKPINGDLFNNIHTYVRVNIGYRINMPKSKFLGRFGLSN